jgi:uncharacterized protein YrrD
MPHLITTLYGNRLGTQDGDIGHVKDIYFDDRRWHVRYVVADTGSWLPRRQVLLSPHAFGSLERHKNTLLINLTRKQIEDSPPIDSRRPVSRQYEGEYFRYYGWPVYWVGDGYGGLGGFPGVIPVPAESAPDEHNQSKADDPHLRSTKAVTGYQVHALDGTVGHVTDFLVNDTTWAICEVIVQTGSWFSSKKVRISPRDIERISYEQSAIFVLLTQEDFKAADESGIVTAAHLSPQAMGIEE